MMREGIEVRTFQFEMRRIPEASMNLIREHNVKIVEIDAYAGTDLYNDAKIDSIDLDLEGDIGDLNKLAIALNAETNKYGYIIK